MRKTTLVKTQRNELRLTYNNNSRQKDMNIGSEMSSRMESESGIRMIKHNIVCGDIHSFLSLKMKPNPTVKTSNEL